MHGATVVVMLVSLELISVTDVVLDKIKSHIVLL